MASDEGTKADQTTPASTTASSADRADAGAAGRSQRLTAGGEAGSSRSPSSEGPGELTERAAFQIRCLRNARYHEDRERFFAKCHKITMFVVVAAGAASLVPLEKQYWILPVIITLAGLVDLVFDVSGKARLHASLRRRIYDLLAQAENEASDICKLHEQAIGVYADEPPCMHAVNALAYNVAMAAFDRPLKFHFKLSWHQRFFRNLWAFAETEFKTIEELDKTVTG
jgi:hypothetical protein